MRFDANAAVPSFSSADQASMDSGHSNTASHLSPGHRKGHKSSSQGRGHSCGSDRNRKPLMFTLVDSDAPQFAIATIKEDHLGVID